MTNPYRAVRDALVASGATRLAAELSWLYSAACGCVFGTTYGKSVNGTYAGAMEPASDRYYDPTIPTSARWLDARRDFRAWAEARGIDAATVAEIEAENDRYMNEGEAYPNRDEALRARYAHMLAWLGSRAEAWEKERSP